MTATDPLSIEEAYQAMFEFLDAYYARTKSDEVGGLLGSLAINHDDGIPMDPGAWDDWLRAVERARAS
jgi:hypothetical protein